MPTAPTAHRTARRIPYIRVDVFTRKPLEGNQLAVFPDARALSDAEMQALAREMNLAETTFVLPRPVRVERERGVRVRIFTVAEELPFAGHPTLGTAFVLRGLRSRAARNSKPAEITLDLNAGPVPVRFSQRGGLLFGEMRQRDPEFGRVHAREEVAAAIGLTAEDLDPDLPAETVSTGLAFCIVPVRRLERLRSVSFAWARAAQYLEASDARFFYLVSRQTQNPAATLHARMIFYNGEDPATGSAAGCAAAWMARHGVLKPGARGMIEQGIAIRRPSQIFVRADVEGGRVGNVRVGGHVVEMMRGQVRL